jgi:hypothetical protein
MPSLAIPGSAQSVGQRSAPIQAASGRRPGGRATAALRLVPAWVITAVFGLAYVIAAPPSADLAAAAYRSELFARVGFAPWDDSWYGGHHLPGYSLLAPAFGSWIGVQLLAALSMVAATALFERLTDGLFGAQATRVAAIWFAVGASVSLLANRVPFDLGLALGLACLLAVRRHHRVPALALALLSALASPVAGVFLALALAAWALAARQRSEAAWALALTAAALAPIALLQLAFPEGGTQPFVGSAFWPALGGVLVIAALVARDARRGAAELAHRALLTGVLLYAVLLVGAYAIPSAVGGNADRLGALLAGPLAACVLLPRHRVALAVLAPFLLYWQVNAPLADFRSAASDPAAHAGYYSPLVAELRALGVGYGRLPARIEAVPTRDHGEARFLAAHVALARGWERQLDVGRNAIFYGPARQLGPARYHEWLAQNAISYVALPDAPLDYSGTAEARLLRRGGAGAYLHEVWRSRHWRLFAVSGAAALAQAPAAISSLGIDSFTLRVPRAGSYLVRVRFTPYWALARGRGCVLQAPGGFTEVRTASAGSAEVVFRFSLARVLGHGPRCS